jgi:hypothetical protein
MRVLIAPQLFVLQEIQLKLQLRLLKKIILLNFINEFQVWISWTTIFMKHLSLKS